jgi:Rrf2 family protein
MKLSAQEEYGLRCLLHLARCRDGESMTIPEISKAEGLSIPNVAKLMRLLRMGGMVKSVRGQAGGYTLSKPAGQIPISHVMEMLGGQFFGPKFCDRHSGRQDVCTHFTDCSLRSLWNTVQLVLHEVFGKTTLQDLLCNESQMRDYISDRAAQTLPLLIRQRVETAAKPM